MENKLIDENLTTQENTPPPPFPSLMGKVFGLEQLDIYISGNTIIQKALMLQ